MKTYTVEVTQLVHVTIDETKFTPAFMADFSQVMHDFATVDEHVDHLAVLFAMGLVDEGPNERIEGYGEAKDMGIKFARLPGGSNVEIIDG